MVFSEGDFGFVPSWEARGAVAGSRLNDPLHVLCAVDVLDQDTLLSVSQRDVFHPAGFGWALRADIRTALETGD